MPRTLRGRNNLGPKWADVNFDLKQELKHNNAGVMPITPAFTTSDFPGGEQWSEEDPPAILFYLQPPKRPGNYNWKVEPLLDENQQPVKSQHDNSKTLRDLPTLPNRISVDVPGWMMMAWRRADPRIILQDIIDRMTTDLGDAQNATQRVVVLPGKNMLQNRCNRNFGKLLRYYRDGGNREIPRRAEVEAVEGLTKNNIDYNTTLAYHAEYHRLIKVKFVRNHEGGPMHIEQMNVTAENLGETTYALDRFTCSDIGSIETANMFQAVETLFTMQERAVRHGLLMEQWKTLPRSCLPAVWFSRTGTRVQPTSTSNGGCAVCTWKSSDDDDWHGKIISKLSSQPGFISALRSRMQDGSGRISEAKEDGESSQGKSDDDKACKQENDDNVANTDPLCEVQENEPDGSLVISGRKRRANDSTPHRYTRPRLVVVAGELTIKKEDRTKTKPVLRGDRLSKNFGAGKKQLTRPRSIASFGGSSMRTYAHHLANYVPDQSSHEDVASYGEASPSMSGPIQKQECSTEALEARIQASIENHSRHAEHQDTGLLTEREVQLLKSHNDCQVRKPVSVLGSPVHFKNEPPLLTIQNRLNVNSPGDIETDANDGSTDCDGWFYRKEDKVHDDGAIDSRVEAEDLNEYSTYLDPALFEQSKAAPLVINRSLHHGLPILRDYLLPNEPIMFGQSIDQCDLCDIPVPSTEHDAILPGPDEELDLNDPLCVEVLSFSRSFIPSSHDRQTVPAGVEAAGVG